MRAASYKREEGLMEKRQSATPTPFAHAVSRQMLPVPSAASGRRSAAQCKICVLYSVDAYDGCEIRVAMEYLLFESEDALQAILAQHRELLEKTEAGLALPVSREQGIADTVDTRGRSD